MGNIEPPWCPSVDRRTVRITRDGVDLELLDDELARASLTLRVRGFASTFTVAEHTEGSKGQHLEPQRFVTGDAPLWLLDEFGAPHPR